MADNLFLLLVGIVVLATKINAQSPYCPSAAYTNGIYCRCYTQDSGLRIECDANYYSNTSPEKARDALVYFQTNYGPVVSFLVYDITQAYFTYIPDNFLAGYQIPNVTFQCSHSQSVNSGLLTFSVNAFNDDLGQCDLTGNVKFKDCNLRQFYGSVFKNCDKLENIAFNNSHVDGLIDIPTLKSLRNLTVFTPTFWTGATHQGLSLLTLAPGASFPLLTYLDLTGNSLNDDSIAFVTELSAIEEMHLEGNNFASVPNLTNNFYLCQLSVTLNQSSSAPILLPNPRSQVQSLKATFYSNADGVNEVTALEGFFVNDVINLKLNMTKFTAEVFLDPLVESSGLNINLNPASRIECGCSISWLVRDNPTLLAQVHSGTCADGRPFESYPLEDVSCCKFH